MLAAGQGSRLGALGAETPKWLLGIGERTIADRQIEAVERARERIPEAVGSVRVVTGHAVEAIERYLGARDGAVEQLHNADFATLNNWYSVLLALRALDVADGERVVIVNGDLFAAPEWMAQFMIDSTRTDVDSLIGIDLERVLTDESMKVATRSGVDGSMAQLERIGKADIDDPVGEYVGLLMAGGPVLADFRSTLESFVGDADATHEWYERAVGHTAASGTPWHLWPTPDGAWVEIDDDGDYAAACELGSRF